MALPGPHTHPATSVLQVITGGGEGKGGEGWSSPGLLSVVSHTPSQGGFERFTQWCPWEPPYTSAAEAVWTPRWSCTLSDIRESVYCLHRRQLQACPLCVPRIPACTGGAFRNIRREVVSLAVTPLPAPLPYRALGALKGPAEPDWICSMWCVVPFHHLLDPKEYPLKMCWPSEFFYRRNNVWF